jgi:MFS family permease
MEETFIIQGFFGLVVALFEVPSAYLGDLWGRKNILLLGAIIEAIGFGMLLIVEDFWGLLFYEMLLGVGASFISGAEVSILYDSMSEDDDKTKIMGSLQTHTLLGEAFASLVCAAMMMMSFRAVILAQVIIAWIPVVIAFKLIEPPIERMDKKTHKENIKEVINYIFFDQKLIRLIFFNMLIWSLATFFAVWIIQKYWQDLGVALPNIALFWGACLVIAAFTTQITHKFEKKYGAKILLHIMCILPVVSYITMGLFPGILGLSATILFYISRGLNSVLMRDAFNSRVMPKFRNTANSISSFAFRGVFFIVAPAIGYSIDKYGSNATLIVIGAMFFLIYLLLSCRFIKSV